MGYNNHMNGEIITYPLTKAQKSILIIEKFHSGTSFVNACATVRIKENLDYGLLSEAINLILERNEALRARIIFDAEPTQYFAPYQQQTFELLDFSDAEKDYHSWEKSISRRPFTFYDLDLFYFALIKFGDSDGAFYLKCHHINVDAWSVISFVNELLRYYCSLKEGIHPEDRNKKSFVEHIADEQKYLTSPKFLKDKAFWKDIIAKITDPNLFEKRKTNNTTARRKSYDLPLEVSMMVNRYCTEYRVSPFIIYASILAIFFWKTKGKEVIVIGAPFLNRSGIKEKNTVGMFLNNLPFVIEIDSSCTYRTFLNNLSSEWMKLLRHGRYPYVNILKEYREAHEITGRLNDITLSFQNAVFDVENINFDTEWHFHDEEVNPLSITINDRESKGTYHLDYDFAIDILEEEIEAINKGLLNLLKQSMDNPDKNIGSLNILSEAEEQIINKFNHTDIPYPSHKTIVHLFQEQVKNNPDSIALVFNDEELTYGELDIKSSILAGFLKSNGVRQEEIVGLRVRRSFDLVIGIIGILKAGAAYLPLDPDYPRERVLYMLQDSKCSIVLTNCPDGFIDDIEEINLQTPDIWQRDISNFEYNYTGISSDLAYVIYTSGSTGLPKGVMVEHRALNNFVHTITQAVDLSSYKTVISLTTLSFDIFFLETILPILMGMKVVIASDSNHNDPSSLIGLIKKHKVEVLQATPTRMKTILNESSGSTALQELFLILIGGEAFSESLLPILLRTTKAKIYNMYGPTETTIWSTTKRLDNAGKITIGKPIGNTKIHILDKYFMPLPIGVSGEIFVSGEGLARGYLNKPELTDRSFFNVAFISETRIYKTGDIGKWLPNGEIEYIGRNDSQVKIRGFRIELGEIEKCLLKLDDVKEAVVISNQSNSERNYLCAYLTGTEKVSIPQLREHLSKYLPDYMIPARFAWLPSLPQTLNGKVNRQTLPKINEIEGYRAHKYEAPRNTIEQILTQVWSEVLEGKQIGIDDDFFTLGGDSLAILEILSGVVQNNWKLTAQDFYEYPTIRQLSSVIIKGTQKKHGTITKEMNDNSLVIKDAFKSQIPYQPMNNENILLTGASGFLGIHLLRELLENTSGKIYCLMRGQDAERRLSDLFTHYFPHISKDHLYNRVIVINGDISTKQFGLSNQEYLQLQEEVSSVIHSAAMVKHYGPYNEFEKVNVKGTQEVIEFCINSSKHLGFISTTSVSGNYMNSKEKKKVFDENDLYIGQDYMNNVYVRSKFEAEYQILKAVENGLKATIFRVGVLTGRYSDGVFQHNIEENAFYRKLKSIFEISYLPGNIFEEYIEFTPVDYCADAIVQILMDDLRQRRVYHIFNHKVIRIRDFIDILKPYGIKVVEVTSNNFSDIISKLSTTNEGKQMISGIVSDVIAQGGLSFSSGVIVDSTSSLNDLRKLDFDWPEITAEYLGKVVTHMKKKEFLKSII